MGKHPNFRSFYTQKNSVVTNRLWMRHSTFSKKMGMFSLTTVYLCSQYLRTVKEHNNHYDDERHLHTTLFQETWRPEAPYNSS